MSTTEIRSLRRWVPSNVAEPVSGTATSGGKDTAAYQLVGALLEAGVDTFFGIPGGPVSPLFDAVLRTPGARLIEARHETSAAFAAAMYGRASGRVACVLVTAGPGATNVVTGVTSAFLSRIPLLVISGDVAWETSGARLLQDSGPHGIGIENMLRTVTRATMRVARAESAAAQALAALREATSPLAPGPVLLVVPMDRARSEVNASSIVSAARDVSMTAPAQAIEQAARWLLGAERPLIVLGAGVRAHAGVVRELVDTLNVPFVTTPQAKGLVSEQHPRSLRNGGLGASLWARKYCDRGVDVALVLGTDLDDCATGPTRYVAPGGKLVHVDLDSAVFERNFPVSLGVVADAGSFARELTRYVRERGLRHPHTDQEVALLRQNSPFDAADYWSDASVPIAPHRALADLARACGPNSTYITDIGEHMLFALHYLTSEGPEAFHVQLSLGSMGSGVCGAIGLALGKPGRRVVCICGDGSLQMVGMELLVAVKERLPIVFAVFNDARYNMVYHGHNQLYGQVAPWDTPWVDFVAWAQAIGVPARSIRLPGEIDEAKLADLTAGGGPALLDIRIDRDLRMKAGGRNESLLRMSLADTLQQEDP